ncbi:Vgb family protein [Nitrospira sp. M1]
MKGQVVATACGAILCCSLFFALACAGAESHDSQAEHNPVNITEWTVPWEQTRPRDPYVDRDHHVWFVGQQGDYVAMLDPKTGKFRQYPLESGTGPHNLLVDEQGFVWYAGNRSAHIGKLDPATGKIMKYMMPNSDATDPHTLVFGDKGEIWFTVQQGNFVGRVAMASGIVTLTPLFTANARPYGIIVDADHVPWFTEFGSNKLGTINRRTHAVKEISLSRPEARPRRLGLTSDGAIWYVDYAEGYLGRVTPSTKKVKEWQVPGGKDAWPYGMAVDKQDRVWFVETGSLPNRLIGFDTKTEEVISITNIKSGGGTVRHMVYHKPTHTIWFGTDANTIARVAVPQ